MLIIVPVPLIVSVIVFDGLKSTVKEKNLNAVEISILDYVPMLFISQVFKSRGH